MKRAEIEKRSDDDLVRLAKTDPASQPAKEAASALLHRYRERVFRWCLSRVRDPELALDLSQDVLLSAYRKLHTFDGRASFSSWLFAIARNRCLNSLRRPDLFDGDKQLAVLPDPAPRQDQELEEREDEERLLRLVRKNLDPLDQQVLWLRCFEKVPVEVITKLLNISSPSGARGILQRARRRLRAALISENGAKGETRAE